MPVPPIDLELIAFFNRPGEPWLDWVMRAASSRLFSLPLLGLLFGAIWIRSPQKQLGAVILILAVGLTDLASARVIKPYFDRTRPCATQPRAYSKTIDGCGSGEAMPSIHAADAAAAATVIFWALPKLGPLMACLAILIGVSRVYLGQHWPSDVGAGWLLGAALGAALIWIVHLRYAVTNQRRYK